MHFHFALSIYFQEVDIHNKLIDDSLLLWEMEEELLQEAVSFVSKTPSESSPHDEESLEIYVEFLNVLRYSIYILYCCCSLDSVLLFS